MVSVLMTVGQYALCVFVTPELASDGELDLREFHEREHRRYAIALLVLCALAIGQNVLLAEGNAYSHWLRDSVASVALAVPATLALLVRARWAQIGAALVIASQATYFMILAFEALTTGSR